MEHKEIDTNACHKCFEVEENLIVTEKEKIPLFCMLLQRMHRYIETA